MSSFSVMYGETRQIRPYETRRYQLALEVVPVGDVNMEPLAAELRQRLKEQVEGWYLDDLQHDLEGSE